MRCTICPLEAASTESLDQVFSKIARCDECDIEKSGGSSRLVSLLRQAGKESRKVRADSNRLKQELRDFQDGTNTDRSRIEKLEFLHATVMRELESALADRDEVVQQQMAAIRALSSPILEVSSGVLAVPIIGTLSEERAHDMMHDLLMAIINRGAEQVALDLTGLASLDGPTAERIASLCKAVALIGARVVISGLRPDVVGTLVAANIDFSSVKTVRSLKDAIAASRQKSTK
jgi:anti-anti-sigma regulatory factor